jgi:hypothetical protein
MKYVLEDLIRVRRIREDGAQHEVIRKRHDLETAAQSVVEKKAGLSDYIKWRVAKEDRLYSGIQGKIVGRQDLEDLKLKVALMRDQEAAYEKDVEEAERALEIARDKLEEAKGNYRSAVREVQKMDEHKKAWLTERHKEEELEAEKELEDFHPKSEQYADEGAENEDY